MKSKIEKLRELIRYHEHNYYVDNQPEISDIDFDRLMQTLVNLETASRLHIPSDSPTQRVGGEVVLGTRVQHRNAMLSLSNTYDVKELSDFDNRIGKILPNSHVAQYVSELKIDGLGVSLIYEDGIFSKGLTRGDGLYGEDITNNLRTIRSIPLSLVGRNIGGTIEVRGEVYMPTNTLDAVNEKRVADGDQPFANARNAAAGSLRLQDPTITDKRPLDIFVYNLNYADNVVLTSHMDMLGQMIEWGFKCNPYTQLHKSIAGVDTYYKYWMENRGTLDYDIDGIVVKLDSTEHQEMVGFTSKYPRWATSYKFDAQSAITTVKDIEIQVGRTGVLTPVAILEPVNIAGATITHATLHNYQEIIAKDIRINDQVILERAGDVIPKILKSLKDKRIGNEVSFVFPKTCVVCGSAVQQLGYEVAIRCTNVKCEAQLKRRIEHFVCRDALDIDGLGAATIDQLVDNELVEDVADLYSLELDSLVKLDRIGIKSATNLLEKIDNSKQASVEKVLYGLGISHVGRGVTEKLIDKFGTIDAVSHATVDDIILIDGIGGQIAEGIVEFFPDNTYLIDKLKAVGLSCFDTQHVPNNLVADEISDNFFSDKAFVITGSLDGMTRKEISEKIKMYGGKVSSSVSSKTDYLIAGANAGSKHAKAVALDISILTESDLYEKIGEK